VVVAAAVPLVGVVQEGVAGHHPVRVAGVAAAAALLLLLLLLVDLVKKAENKGEKKWSYAAHVSKALPSTENCQPHIVSPTLM